MPSKPTESFPTTVCDSNVPLKIGDHALNEKEREAYNRIFLDYDATLSANKSDDFPFSSDALIEHAKFVYLRLFISKDYENILSDDFTFAGPVVGPIPKNEFTQVFSTMDLASAFPQATSGLHNMIVDPFMPNRVFFTSLFDGVHKGNILGYIKPTGQRVVSPPQISSFTFNNQGKVTHLTTGYVLDRHIGNTGGLGALYGILYAIGKPLPFPECHPHTPSIQYRLFRMFAGFTRLFARKKTQVPAVKDKEEGQKEDVKQDEENQESKTE